MPRCFLARKQHKRSEEEEKKKRGTERTRERRKERTETRYPMLNYLGGIEFIANKITQHEHPHTRQLTTWKIPQKKTATFSHMAGSFISK